MQSASSRDLRSHSLSSIASSTPRNSLENEFTVLPSFDYNKSFLKEFVEPQPDVSISTSQDPAGDVAGFFARKSVFITGATGFVGKVLVEKLLRSCSDVEKIFVLVRPKKGVDPDSRVQKEFGDCELFRRVQRYNSDYLRKIFPIHGDMTKPGLGISESDVKLLQDEVAVVFHVAATVRFDENLKLALQLNVIAAKDLMKISRGMKKLQSYQHVSTAYAHCDKANIDEILYPAPADVDQLHSSLGWMTDEMVTKITPDILHKKPNTYTFTKAIAEHMVLVEGAGLPISIVRPSIVGATWKEPFPGWIDNYHGACGLMIACGKGMLPSVIGDVYVNFDLIPVDVVVNNMVAAAWHTAVKRPIKVPIYNCVSGTSNPLKLLSFGVLLTANAIHALDEDSSDVEITYWKIKKYVKHQSVVRYFYNSPMEVKFRTPTSLRITKNEQLFDWCHFIQCKLPSMVVDFGFKLTGRKRRLTKMAGLVGKSVYTLKYFTCNEWQWSTDNVTSMYSSLGVKDKVTFSTDLGTLNWSSYIDTFCSGIKEFVLKENISRDDVTERHMTSSKIILRRCLLTIAPLVAFVFLRRTPGAKNVILRMQSLASLNNIGFV